MGTYWIVPAIGSFSAAAVFMGLMWLLVVIAAGREADRLAEGRRRVAALQETHRALGIVPSGSYVWGVPVEDFGPVGTADDTETWKAALASTTASFLPTDVGKPITIRSPRPRWWKHRGRVRRQTNGR